MSVILEIAQTIMLVALLLRRRDGLLYRPPVPWRHRLRMIWLRPSRGLGDTVAKMTETLGVRPCVGCKGRQDALNKAVPYRSEVHSNGE